MTDERYKELMAQTPMPNSRSVLLALQQVANEVAQECSHKSDELITARVKELKEENEWLKSELQLVTAPRESVGSVITALRSRIEDLEEECAGLRSTLEEVETGLRARMVENDSLRSELTALRRSSEHAIAMTQELCSCGGSAPDDPKACDACKIYHALRASRAAEKGEQG